MFKKNIFKQYLILAVATLGLTVFQSCSEEIDMSDRYTFTEYTIASYLQEHDTTYSEYYRLLDEVKISSRSKSTVRQLMSARGNFTVFAPTNKAIQLYLDTLYAKGIISEPSWEGFESERTLDSIRGVIVYNSIIDGGNDIEAYQTSGFPNNGEEIMLPNMNDRKLAVYYGSNPDSIYINGSQDATTKVVTGGSLLDLKNRDIIAVNGCIHSVHQVVAPSNMTVGDKFREMIDTQDPTYSVMAQMIIACGFQDTLSQIKDEIFEELYLSSDDDFKHNNLAYRGHNKIEAKTPEHRKYGFTVFAETNDFWENAIGKSASDITLEDLKSWIIAQNFYPNADTGNNYSDTRNVVNQFVSYHILPMRLPIDKLVVHYNEKGWYFTDRTKPYTTPVWELYTTMGEPRLLKIYQGNAEAGPDIYLNSFPVLNNGRDGDYKEVSCEEIKRGSRIDTERGINIFNGFIYPIDKVLAYDDNTKDNFHKERLRFDVASLFPEFMNNDLRYNIAIDDQKFYMHCEDKYRYLENVDILKGTDFVYLTGVRKGWNNYQGDELNITGKYEMTFKLPPVPKAGTYEIRYAVQNNSGNRGMCQVYFGSSKKQMPAMGIPLDLRIGGTDERLGWEPDVKLSDGTHDYEADAEIDKKMRNNGFMKGANVYNVSGGLVNTGRDEKTTTRRIIVKEWMEPGKTYYLKFKSVLEDDGLEFYMDYIEFCAKEVYDNPNEPEDIW